MTTTTNRDQLIADLKIKVRDINRRNKEQQAANSHAADVARWERHMRYLRADLAFRDEQARVELAFVRSMKTLAHNYRTGNVTKRQYDAIYRGIGQRYDDALADAKRRHSIERFGR